MSRFAILLSLAGLELCAGFPSTHGASFRFGSGGIQNSISGLEQTVLSAEGVVLSIQAGPVGSKFNDSDSQGLGIDSVDETLGVVDSDRNKLNFITGHPGGPKVAESITFSFNRPGVLRDLLLDGIKDETLEYFVLTLPDGDALTIFDSQAEFRLGIQGFSLSDLSVLNPVECQTEEDDLTSINYFFAADEVFTLTYGEGNYDDVPGYKTNPNFPQFPNAVGDGARFEGIIVEAVPEPSSILLAGVLVIVAGCCRRK